MIKITIDGNADYRVVELVGTESLASLFQYSVIVATESADTDIESLLAKKVELIFAPLNRDNGPVITGIVTKIEFLEKGKRFYQYKIMIESVFGLLTRRTDTRIFQNKNSQEIIEDVFKTADIPSDQYQFNLTGKLSPRAYCVQYNESDWDFIDRLAQEEGWYYFFQNKDNLHRLTIANHRDAHVKHDPYKVSYQDETGQASDQAYVSHFEMLRGLAADTWSTTDYFYTKPGLDQVSVHATKPARGLERFTYPGLHTQSDDGKRLVKVRLDAEQSQQRRYLAKSRLSTMSAGIELQIDDGRRGSNKAVDLLIVSIRHSAFQPQVLEEDAKAIGEKYQNEFTCVDANQIYRNPIVSRKPRIEGFQTARVVGPAGEKIYTDEYGRVKVQFHWDRLAKNDEHSSCWVRVMQSWAGGAYGSFVLPRIDQEVVVQFENGDPDRPMVIGTVYNGVNRTSFTQPENKTQTGIRTQIIDGDGFHELRFEDKADNAGIYLQSGKDVGARIKNDSQTYIGNDSHLIVTKNQIERVDGDKHQHVKGDQATKIEGTLSIDIGADFQSKVAGDNIVETSGELHVKSGKKVILEAGSEVTIKVGGNFIKIDSGGVTVVGSQIKLNSGGSAGSGKGVSTIAPVAAKEFGAAKKVEAKKLEKANANSPPSAILLAAALSGAPFCEKCARLGKNNTAAGISNDGIAKGGDRGSADTISQNKKKNSSIENKAVTIIQLCEKYWNAYLNDCSGFVKAVGKDLGVELQGHANEIVDQIEKEPWISLRSGAEAKTYAAEGMFVVAGLRDSPHGHVVIVVDGPISKDKYPTAYWGSLNGVPKKNTTLNWSWNKNDVDNVSYHARKV